MMDKNDWTILVVLYEEKNITKAAERLFISQPALTYRIQQLEKEYNTKIVLRGKKGVEFTAQGELLVEYARNMLIQHRKIKEIVQNMENRVRGSLRIGVSSNFARYQLPVLLKNFLKVYPEVEINVKTGWSSEVLQLVYKEEVHIGIVRGDFIWHEQKHLLNEEAICIVSKKPINLDDLPNLPRINYITDPHLKNTIETWWHNRYTRPPLITMEVDRIETCKEMVLYGLGYAIFPSIGLHKNDELYKVNLTTDDGQPITRKTWLIYKDETLELSITRAFVDFTLNYSYDNWLNIKTNF